MTIPDSPSLPFAPWAQPTSGSGWRAVSAHAGHCSLRSPSWINVEACSSGFFPDGQLFADLRGLGPGGAATEPEEVLQQFLISLGVPPAAVPARTTACTALLRTVLAERRVLLVLDNARDEEQVRLLLPGASGCMVRITSRG